MTKYLNNRVYMKGFSALFAGVALGMLVQGGEKPASMPIRQATSTERSTGQDRPKDSLSMYKKHKIVPGKKQNQCEITRNKDGSFPSVTGDISPTPQAIEWANQIWAENGYDVT